MKESVTAMGKSTEIFLFHYPTPEKWRDTNPPVQKLSHFFFPVVPSPALPAADEGTIMSIDS